MKKEIDENENNENEVAKEINKRLQDIIDRKRSESEAFKKILKAFIKNEDTYNSTIQNIKNTENEKD